MKAGFVPKEEQKLYRPPSIAVVDFVVDDEQAREKLMEEKASLNHGLPNACWVIL